MAKQNEGPRLALNEAGIYEIRWTDAGRSKRKSTHSSDMSIAKAFFARWMLASEEREKAKHRVSGILDAYYSEHVEDRVVDKARQQDCIRCLSKELGHFMPTDLSHEVMRSYRQRRQAGLVNGHPVGPGTLRRELNCLVAALNHAVRHRRINAADVPHIDLPTPPPPKDLHLDEDEAEHLWKTAEAIGGRVFLFLAVAMETASRKNAIQTLKWSQVDLAAGLIHFQHDGQARTNKRRVAVPMSTRLASVLKAAKESASTEWVLITPYSIQHAFDRLKAAAYQATGNPKFMQITPHTLRHTWATLAARAGVDLFQIAGVLGDTVQTVMRVYAHHSPDHLRSAINFRAQAVKSPVT